MNYRHHFHAGNFADVVKHALLVRLVRALQGKPKPFVYLDTHAGRGHYDLAAAAVGASLARTPEWPDGIGRLWQRADAPAEVADYLAVVREFDRQRGNLELTPRFYPGSPWLARQLCRAEDRLVLCEKHPAEAAALRDELGRRRAGGPGPRVIIQETDGYGAVRAILPPPERRALVLIDPPYEEENEFEQAAAAVAEALRRLPGAVCALWYPLTGRARVQEFLAALLALQLPPTLAAEVAIAGDDSVRKLKGCGLVIVNPPWQYDRQAKAIVEYLAPVLAQEDGASSRVQWLVPER